MFLSDTIDFVRGFVAFEAEGGLPERMMLLLREQEIPVWRLRRNETVLRGRCRIRDYRRLRTPARRTGMRLHHTEKHGLPFWLHRYRARLGLPLGGVVAALLLWWLSGGIWAVTVTGADGALASEICAALEPMGVCVGGRAAALRPAEIQLQALDRLPAVTWLAVNMNGCVAEIHVLERQVGEPAPQTVIASNLVASRDGVIVRTEVRSGQKAVQVGEGVTAGTLLVSGVVETTAGPLLRRAEATILAKTERVHSASVPLRQTQLLPTGETVRQPSLCFFGLRIPLYTSSAVPAPYRLEERRATLTAAGRELPLGLEQRVYVLLAPTEVRYTEAEAKELALEQLQQWEEEELCDATVHSRTYAESVQNGVFTLTVTCDCTEDIALEQVLVSKEQE